MKICVYGLGAIGGLLAARLSTRLSATGHELTCIARGETLSAVQKRGLIFTDNDEQQTVPLSCSDNPEDIGPQEVVFLTTKAYSIPQLVNSIKPLLGPDTVVVTMCNGVPWWYHYGRTAGAQDYDSPVAAVDPAGVVWQGIGPQRAIGCVVYPAARVEAPGVVRHISGDKFSLGEPAAKPGGAPSERVSVIADALQEAGFETPVSDNIRAEVWFKLVANAAYNPVSLVTGKTLGEMFDDRATCQLLITIMHELILVAGKQGYPMPLTPEQLIDATRPFAAHKTSMLLDLEAGRPVELDALVVAVQELAQASGVMTPALDTMQALAAAKASAAGCY